MKRFWDKVKKSEYCWDWTAYRQKRGYGVFVFKSKDELAHRVSWILKNGEIPAGMCICHKCDNPSCVRPGHLFIGTHKDNMNDRNKKGRARGGSHVGENNPTAKLTKHQAAEIRRRYIFRKVTSRMLSKEFGVSNQTIINIVHNRVWKD